MATQEELDAVFEKLDKKQQDRAAAAGSRTLAGDVAGVGTQVGVGANIGLANIVGAPLDAYDWLLKQGGIAPLFGRAAPPPSLSGLVTGETDKGQTATERLQALRRRVLGEPEATTPIERGARAVGEGGVEAASMLVPGMAAARLGRAGGVIAGVGDALTTQPLSQIAAGGVGSAVTQATDSPLLGLGASLVTPSVLSGARRIVSPVSPASLERQRLVAQAEREGIPVTAGQATDNRFLKNVESSFDQGALTSGPARRQAIEAEEAFTRAATRRTGVASNNAGPDFLNDGRARIGAELRSIAGRNNVEWSPGLQQDLATFENGLQREVPGIRDATTGWLDDILRRVEPAGPNVPHEHIPGRDYAIVDSRLGRDIRGTTDGDRRRVLGELRGILRTHMDDSIQQHGNPADVTDWAEARRQYANLQVITRAMGGAGTATAEGRLSPLRLQAGLASSVGRDGVALGRGDLNDLSRIGQSVLRPVPDSGTEGRTLARTLTGGTLGGGAAGGGLGAAAGTPLTGALTGAALGAARVGVPRAIQAGMETRPAQAWLRNQVLPPLNGAEAVPGVAVGQGLTPTESGAQRRDSLGQVGAAILSPLQRAILGY